MNSRSNIMEQAFQDEIVHIPKSSFTAFRLTYQSPRHLSETSKCVLLGGVPHLWLLDNKPGFFTGAASHAKKKAKKRFRDAVTTVNSSIRSSSRYKVTNRGSGPEGGFNLFFRDPKGRNIEDIVHEVTDAHLQEAGNSDDETSDATSNEDTDDTRKSLESYLDDYDAGMEVSSPVKSFFRRAETNSKSDNHKHDEFNVENLTVNDIEDMCESKELTSKESIVLGEESMVVFNPPATNNAELKVTFTNNTRKTSSAKKRVEITMPAPYEMSPEELIQAQKENHRFRKKFKHFAKGSKNMAMSKGNDLRLRIYNNIWRSYEVGQVMRMDKMLILIKQAHNVKIIGGFGENEPCDSRVYERWKEYLVVLRKAENIEEPLSVQLYDIHSTTSDTKVKPEFSFKLTYAVRNQFYSGVDKSISLTIPKESGAMIYIMKCSNQFTSFRWLYFIRQFLRHNFERTFRVSIPGLKLSLLLEVPDSAIAKLFRKEEFLEIRILKQGYKIEYSPLVQYLKDTILEKLKSNRSAPDVESWLLENNDPWFCFKQYDRLEWIINNGAVFYMQNQLLSRTFQLEFRQKTSHQRHTITEQGKNMKEPLPIEGFLSRLTNITGYEKSLLRTFHKISYFYSSDNILFFTKFFRGMPPSPNNALLNDDVTDIITKLPLVYERDPFPIDSNEHISWLNKSSFEYYDQNAMQELERRAQQIIKAEALIDICLIVDVRAVPIQNNRKAHNLLLCLLWYSAPELINDESIVDSSFEIEMKNGSVIKLQAPCRIVRDEWVTRLIELRDYWISRKCNDLNGLIHTRLQNQNELKINEYTDSNIIQESGVLGNTYADANMYNIDCISMSKCVLMSGYLYQKLKKHANFNQYYIVLCPGFLVLFSLYKRSKRTGAWKRSPYFEHYLTIPISDCYVYSGQTTCLDLLEEEYEFRAECPGQSSLPRIYSDGWKSSEEVPLRCFTLWFGKKRGIGKDKAAARYEKAGEEGEKACSQKNPGLIRMVKKLGVTGKSIVFMARSRQERELWVQRISAEIDRFAKDE